MMNVTKNGMNQYLSNTITDLYLLKLLNKLTTAMITTLKMRDT